MGALAEMISWLRVVAGIPHKRKGEPNKMQRLFLSLQPCNSIMEQPSIPLVKYYSITMFYGGKYGSMHTKNIGQSADH